MQSKNWELSAEIANSLFFISKGLAKFRHCFAKISVRNVNVPCKIQQERTTSQLSLLPIYKNRKWFHNDCFHFNSAPPPPTPISAGDSAPKRVV